jgi:threonine dehydratase
VTSVAVSLADVEAAAARIAGLIKHTPVLTSRTFSEMSGARVSLKAENLQRTGSFKIRGAANFIAQMTPAEQERGVIAASAGNHAQGVALAASTAGVAATIVMPRTASFSKVAATRGYGAQVVLEGEDFAEAVAAADRLAAEHGHIFVSAFDDAHVIAGQGTIALELLEQAPSMQTVVVPIGGGGLIGGMAVALKHRNPRLRVVGVQASAEPAVVESLREGRRVTQKPDWTVADGIAVSSPGELTWPLIQQYVDDVVMVSEEEISRAMILLLERAKLLVEGAGAVGVAALLSGAIRAVDQDVTVVLSGGNVDANLLARTLEHGLAHAGRYLVLSIVIQDRPGALAKLLSAVGETEANVIDVDHLKRGPDLGLDEVRVDVTTETRDADHSAAVVRALHRAGYRVEVDPRFAPDPRTWL